MKTSVGFFISMKSLQTFFFFNCEHLSDSQDILPTASWENCIKLNFYQHGICCLCHTFSQSWDLIFSLSLSTKQANAGILFFICISRICVSLYVWTVVFNWRFPVFVRRTCISDCTQWTASYHFAFLAWQRFSMIKDDIWNERNETHLGDF